VGRRSVEVTVVASIAQRKGIEFREAEWLLRLLGKVRGLLVVERKFEIPSKSGQLMMTLRLV
jgi:hypothetical protein